MEEPRRDFKNVVIKNETFLYPTPVVKEKKYLLKVEQQWTDFYIHALKEDFLASPDVENGIYSEIATHQDGRTPILKLDFQKIQFKLLQNRDHDLGKAETIEKLLTTKILNVLKGEDGAQDLLKKAYEKQTSCSTCEKLGINKEPLKKLIEGLVS